MQYICGTDLRRQAVRNSASTNGIDFLEVYVSESKIQTPQAPTLSPRFRALLVMYCFKSINSQGLREENVTIDGGTRIKNIRIDWADSASRIIQDLANNSSSQITDDLTEEEKKIILDMDLPYDRALVIRPDALGDFSDYSIKLVSAIDYNNSDNNRLNAGRPSSGTHLPLQNFDVLLSKVDFSFRANCYSDFDCKPETICPEGSMIEPDIDYMSKDFASFRRIMLDRFSTIIPEWKERNPADMGIVITELVSYVCDHLSYYQDAVATEAYLGTARRRISIRRHARLLDYFVHDGCNARAWIFFELNDQVPGGEEGIVANNAPEAFLVERGTKLLTKDKTQLNQESSHNLPHIVESADFLDSVTKGDVEVFETMQELTVYKNHNKIFFYTWGRSVCCLSAGVTSATVINEDNKLSFHLFEWSDIGGSNPENEKIKKIKESLMDLLDLAWLSGVNVRIKKIPIPSPPPPTSSYESVIEITNGLNSPIYLLLNKEKTLVTVAKDEKGEFEITKLFASKKGNNLLIHTTTLKSGDVLIFEELVSPTTHKQADADPLHRHAVRLSKVTPNYDALFNVSLIDITWSQEDALPFPLCIDAVPNENLSDEETGGHIAKEETSLIPKTTQSAISIARGNVVLADHGYTITKSITPSMLPNYIQFRDIGQHYQVEDFDSVGDYGRNNDKKDNVEFVGSDSPIGATELLGFAPYPRPSGDGFSFNPSLSGRPLTYAAPFDKSGSASKGTLSNPRNAMPAIRIFVNKDGKENTWCPTRDLLERGEFDEEFVIETENDGTAFIRFPNLSASTRGMTGRPSSDGNGIADGNTIVAPSTDRISQVYPFYAMYRIGNGKRGNVGPESISRVVIDGVSKSLFSNIRNPMPALGGQHPEDIELVRHYAPEAFRIQDRAVTPEDYVAVLKHHPEVQRAYATIRWTGSWYTVFVSVDRYGGKPVDEKFKQGIRNFLNHYRLAGYDLEIREPSYVPLQIRTKLCIKPNYYFENVKGKLLEVFSNHVNSDGTIGFFHPDNLTFGQPILLSRLYEAAMSVDGVESCKVEIFQRWGKLPNNEIQNAMINMQYFEIARLDNDQNFPENGRIEFVGQVGATGGVEKV